ncbi:peptidoglycan DD-metalloendopeptidase family protein [Glutamicibacter soli]|uniref:Peptidoglycan DD-metalloendopeptidase family protein n=1 Tax=Glutamicibacter soli TaxID=453836 RepID=A0A6L9GBC7_9MICC|nr:peptidoglycan DD-metalloendopeptidase family protein [Glutamicibacter soli]
MNHEPSIPGRARDTKRALYGAASLALALGISSALATPLIAGPDTSRAVGMEASSGALMDWEITSDAVYVDPYAPLAVFGGAGQVLDIDGRPSSMLENAQRPGAIAGQQEQLVGGTQGPGAQISANNASTLLVGEVGQIGQLPGGLELMPPVKTRRISSPYGWRANPTGPGNQIHIGQDYPIACGSPVYASEDGIVTVSSWAGHSGKRITIDHGHNVQTGYSHNSVLIAAVGQRVKRGELIARAGTTGNSTGCHVHFEVIINGRWHDPRNYLPLNPGQAQAMIDSRRLTVSANSAPKGSKPSSPAKEQKPAKDVNDNPDVVVPEDDTPRVPSPSPSPTHKAPSTDKPSKDKPSASDTPSLSPTPKPTESATPSKPAKPTEPARPIESATAEPTSKPTQPSTPPSSVKPTESDAPTGTATPPKVTESPSVSDTPPATVTPSKPAATPRPTKAPDTPKVTVPESEPAGEPTAATTAKAVEPDAAVKPESDAATVGRVDGE